LPSAIPDERLNMQSAFSGKKQRPSPHDEFTLKSLTRTCWNQKEKINHESAKGRKHEKKIRKISWFVDFASTVKTLFLFNRVGFVVKKAIS